MLWLPILRQPEFAVLPSRRADAGSRIVGFTCVDVLLGDADLAFSIAKCTHLTTSTIDRHRGEPPPRALFRNDLRRDDGRRASKPQPRREWRSSVVYASQRPSISLYGLIDGRERSSSASSCWRGSSGEIHSVVVLTHAPQPAEPSADDLQLLLVNHETPSVVIVDAGEVQSECRIATRSGGVAHQEIDFTRLQGGEAVLRRERDELHLRIASSAATARQGRRRDRPVALRIRLAERRDRCLAAVQHAAVLTVLRACDRAASAGSTAVSARRE